MQFRCASPAREDKAFLQQRIARQFGVVTELLYKTSLAKLEAAYPASARPAPDLQHLLPTPDTAKQDAERLTVSLYIHDPKRAAVYELWTRARLGKHSENRDAIAAEREERNACVSKLQEEHDGLATRIGHLQEGRHRAMPLQAAALAARHIELQNQCDSLEDRLRKAQEEPTQADTEHADAERMTTSPARTL